MKNIFIFLLLCVSVLGQVTPNPLRLKTPASAPAVDDKVYIDGLTNGVRALDPAYFAPAAATTTAIATAQATAISSAATAAASASKSADTVVDGSTNKAYTAAEKTKLAGVATGATANSPDATLLNRANHTGTQSADTLVDGTSNKAFLAAERTKLSGLSASTAAALASNALALTSKPFSVKEATWSSATSNKTFTFASGQTTAGNGAVQDMTFTNTTTILFPAAYRNGASSTISTYSYPAGHYRLVFSVRADGSSIDLNDEAVTAADVPVVATPTNYSPGSPNVESHLVAIDVKLGTVGGGGGSGSGFSISVTQASHGFVAGNFVYFSSGTYAKAKADALATVAVPYFVQSATTNTFVAVPMGRADITGLGYSVGYRFLSDSTAGTTSTAGPTASGSFYSPVMYVESSTVAFINPPYPLTNSSGTSTKTSAYTVTIGDSQIFCNSATPFTVLLYNANTGGASDVTFTNINSATVTLDATSLGQINGSNTVALLAGQSLTLTSNGTNWFVK